jgi:Tol biopolymer transport system component
MKPLAALALALILASCSETDTVFLMSFEPSDSSDPEIRDVAPTWSPDGSRIAFQSLRGGNEDIYVMDADGSNLIRLTTSVAADMHPAWSPDGTRIAFVSSRGADYDIYVMNADGSGQTALTNGDGMDEQPSWSSDGQRIAFTSDRNNDVGLYVMNADGSGVQRLGPAN